MSWSAVGLARNSRKSRGPAAVPPTKYTGKGPLAVSGEDDGPSDGVAAGDALVAGLVLSDGAGVSSSDGVGSGEVVEATPPVRSGAGSPELITAKAVTVAAVAAAAPTA